MQNFIAAPRMKTPMHRFVVGIALRQHVPLRAGIEKSTTLLRTHAASEPACGPDASQECAPPKNDSGCVPTASPSVESVHFYSVSTLASDFEIGSSKLRLRGYTFVKVSDLLSMSQSRD